LRKRAPRGTVPGPQARAEAVGQRSLQIEEPAGAERVFHALAEKGKVRMPLEKTFWASASACWSIASAFRRW
jgi:uncharacterized glyoxalase superfamily protein PhnB